MSAINKPCMAAMDAVLSELGTKAARQKPVLRVVMGDACVHFDVVQGNYSGASDRHLQSIANACIAEILGDAKSSQIVRWQLQPDLRHLLISCIDSRDTAAVTQAAKRHGLQLHSLQPDFCVQWNQYASVLPARPCVFATVNEGYATVAYAQEGTIAALSSGPCFCGDNSLEDGRQKTLLTDERTDRLLASLGQNPSAVSNFFLVTTAPEFIPGVSRWKAFGQCEVPR
ncbi:hypothetical protein [Rhodoferax sp.]|uniref:hypothetical protein n=1 Tax=Rhodoferax sp. TaxID=50421 RepID=UPI0028438ECB|nr:hypothetical protein [Rhodoferax sp.]MDR3370138.1 hypothetical protein [Rhodoferax sp.]